MSRIAIVREIKKTGVQHYASDQYGIDSTIDDDVLERIVEAVFKVLDGPRQVPVPGSKYEHVQQTQAL